MYLFNRNLFFFLNSCCIVSGEAVQWFIHWYRPFSKLLQAHFMEWHMQGLFTSTIRSSLTSLLRVFLSASCVHLSDQLTFSNCRPGSQHGRTKGSVVGRIGSPLQYMYWVWGLFRWLCPSLPGPPKATSSPDCRYSFYRCDVYQSPKVFSLL